MFCKNKLQVEHIIIKAIRCTLLSISVLLNRLQVQRDFKHFHNCCVCAITGKFDILRSLDTQGWLRSLHQPLGQLARKALNLLPKIDTKHYSVRSNQITALISKLFSLLILLIWKWGWNQCNDSNISAVNRRKFN